MDVVQESDHKCIKWLKTQVIGQGTFNTCVFKGEYANLPVAVKRVEKSGFVQVNKEFIQEHITRPKHPNIIQYFAFASDEEFWYVAMEECDLSLSKYIEENQQIEMAERIDLAIQMSESLASLHVHDLWHMNVKPSNFLVKRRNNECDVWSLTQVIYFTITGVELPIENSEGISLPDAIDCDVKYHLKPLLIKMASKDHNLRPDMWQVVLILKQIKLTLFMAQLTTNYPTQDHYEKIIGRLSCNRSKLLGRSMSPVFPGTIDVSNKIIYCAVKRVVKQSYDPKFMTKAWGEISIWTDLTIKSILEGNPSIVRYYGFEADDDFWYIAAEPFDCNLTQFINNTSDESMNYIRNQITKQATEGVSFLHRNGYVHKDIKPDNFLVRQEGDKIICKLNDFGLSKETIEGQSYCTPTNHHGTVNWRAPEATNPELSHEDSQPFSKKSDIWSLGCVISFIFTKRHPFGDWKNGMQIEERVKAGGSPLESHIELVASLKHKELIEKMIKKYPSDRPDIEEVLNIVNTG